MTKYKVDGWDAVLKHLQFNVTRTQLASRWNFHLQYKQQKPKAKPARAKEGPAWTVSSVGDAACVHLSYVCSHNLLQ